MLTTLDNLLNLLNLMTKFPMIQNLIDLHKGLRKLQLNMFLKKIFLSFYLKSTQIEKHTLLID